MLRYGWYESPDEPLRYWLCLPCDQAGIEPCIQVVSKEETDGEDADV